MDSRRIRVDIVGSPRPSRRGQSFVRNDLRPPFDSLSTYPSYPMPIPPCRSKAWPHLLRHYSDRHSLVRE
jgi:hypothetical protein